MRIKIMRIKSGLELANSMPKSGIMMACISLGTLLLSACGQDIHRRPVEVNANAVEEEVVSTANEHKSLVHEEAKALEEQISNSHAYYASQTNFMCPKLLRQPIDDFRIVRRNEVMQDSYCEYYIYPKVGQRINVISKDDKLEKLLVTPAVHNFANGDYTVLKNDRHTIRLNYNAMEAKPKDYRYDVDITVE